MTRPAVRGAEGRMKTAAAFPVAPDARMRKPGPRTPSKRRSSGKNRPTCGDAPDRSAAPTWCVHCYQVLRNVRAQRAHRCPEKVLAKLPASPPPYN
jgi:hypothetical protein